MKKCYYKCMIKLYIRVMMEERHMKPKQLAEQVGMSVRTLYNIFEGRKCPTICELALFAAVFDVGIEDLYDSDMKHKRRK